MRWERKFKILIVDDDTIVQRLYTKILNIEGYDVATSNTAVGIYETVARHSPDIILMDYQMPLVSGVEAIKQLKSHPLYKAIPIIFFSSVVNLDALAKEAGANTYISKISTKDEILATIQSVTDFVIAHTK